MQRVSSNLTLFFKIFIPVFWAVFFGAFLIALFVEKEALFSTNTSNFRIGAVLFYLSGLAMYYFLFFNLKRVEFSEEHIYVTNYFKTVRYSWPSVDRISNTSFLTFTIATIELKEAGIFGKSMTFLASRKHYKQFMLDHPGVLGESI